MPDVWHWEQDGSSGCGEQSVWDRGFSPWKLIVEWMMHTHTQTLHRHTHYNRHIHTYAFCEYVTCAASAMVCIARAWRPMTNNEVSSEASPDETSPDALDIHGTILNITEKVCTSLRILRFSWGSCTQETPTAIRDSSVGAKTQPGGKNKGARHDSMGRAQA